MKSTDLSYEEIKLNEKMAETIEAALIAGRGDVVSMLSDTVSIKSLVRAIIDCNKDQVKKSMIELLVRDKYSREDVSNLTDYNLYHENDIYPETLHTIVRSISDQETLLYFFSDALSCSLHSLAKEAMYAINNNAVVKNHLDTYITGMTGRAGRLHYEDAALRIMLGSTENWCKDTFDILEALDYEAPGPERNTGTYRIDAWLDDRFDVQVNQVGNRLQELNITAPKVVVQGGRLVVERGQELINSLVQHHDRFSVMGMSVEDYPRYVPCEFNTSSRDALMEMGGHIIEPQLSMTSPNGKELPHHGYCAEENGIAPWEVCMSTALLSNNAVSQFMREGVSLMLMPYEAFEPEMTLDPQLHTALRYFRPTPILNALNPDLDFPFKSAEKLPLDLYLKGVPLVTQRIRTLILENSIRCLDDISCMVSDIEKSHLYEIFVDSKTHRGYPSSFSFNQKQNGKTNEEIKRLESWIKGLTDYFGEQPRISLRGERSFLEAVADKKWDLNLANLDLVGNADSNDNSKTIVRLSSSYNLQEEYRLAVRMGAHLDKVEEKYGSTPSELLAKGVRCREDSDIQKILGALDRYPLVDVVNAARTPRQLEFAAEHYDIKSVFKELNVKSQRALGRMMLEKGFSVGGLDM